MEKDNKRITWITATGDVVTGDVIRFKEGVFSRGRKPRYLGERTIIAKIIKDSYGTKKQQHTFSLEIIESEGFRALEPGQEVRRKGRNIYRIETERMAWDDEAIRKKAQNEKHFRGDLARKRRDARRINELSENGYHKAY